MAEPSFQIPDFDELPPPEIGEGIAFNMLDLSYTGVDEEQGVYDPTTEVEVPSFIDVQGWTLIYPQGQGSNPLSVGAEPAKVFFPHSDGSISGVMPTLQDTDDPLDKETGGELDAPSYSLPDTGEHTQYLLYDSSLDTARIFFALTATDISTLINSTETAIAIATFEVSGGEITGYEQTLYGPEAFGGGGDSCTALKPSVSGTTFTVSAGISDSDFIAESTHALTGDINAYLVHDVVPIPLDDGSGTWTFEEVTVSNARIVYAVDNSAHVDPEVSGPTTGAATITNGVTYLLWGVATEGDPGEFSLSTARCGNNQTKWCNPQLYVISD